MKKIIFVILFPLALFSQENDVHLDWLTNLEKAQKISKRTHKPILLYITGSDWCPPCKMLKKDFFYTKEFEEKASKFVLVMIDKPRRIDIITEKQMIYNDKIIARYNKEKTFPKVMILNEKGKVLGEIDGYNYLHDTTRHFALVNQYLTQ